MIAGKTAYGMVNGNVIAGCYKWEAEESVVELDNATGATEGYENPEAGLLGVQVTLSVWYDVGLSAYTPVRAGSLVEQLQLFETEESPVPAFDIPAGIVLRSTRGAETRGKLEVTHVIKSKGAYDTNETLI